MDKDLEFLKEVNEEFLGIFVDIMLKKGELTEFLSVSDEYKRYGKDYKKYVKRIAEEYQSFGTNSFCNLIGSYNSYKEILCDVADKMKVNFNKDQSVELIEQKLLDKVLVDAYEKMTPDEKQNLKNIANNAKGKFGSVDIGAETSLFLVNIFRAGGFASYKITLIIINAVAKAVLGRGLSLAANAALARAMSIFAGPIGLAVTALWTLIDIAGPAYRVTIPCTIIIAAMRKEHNMRQYQDFDL